MAVGSCWLLCGPSAQANPAGMSVGSGTAVSTSQGPVLTLSVSDRAVLNWQSFNIAAGEKTIFNQPSAASIVWNQILDSSPSKIFGSIQANGTVVLANQQGFWFGPDSVVKAANFVATTAAAPPTGFFSGGPWGLTPTVAGASIINYGQIQTASGGSLFLVAEKVKNHGVLSAPDGTLGLYAGKEVLVSQRPDGRGLSAKVTLPKGSVDNLGKLVADAGTIALFAQVVNMDGLSQADSKGDKEGVIDVFGSDSVNLGPGSETRTQGSGATPSSGGTVTLRSDGQITGDPTAVVSVRGGMVGGNGGKLELSAPALPTAGLHLDGSAGTGYTSGQLLLDPDTIIINNAASGTVGSGTVNAGDPPTTLSLPTSAFANFSIITLQAKKLIDIKSPWNLVDVSGGGAKLTLESGGNIVFGNSGSIIAGTGWDVTLLAGANFTSPGSVIPGVGSVKGETSAPPKYTLATKDGAVIVTAGQDIVLGAAKVSTTTGSISLYAVSGTVQSDQISVASAGGDISIRASGDLVWSSGQVRNTGSGGVSVISESGSISAGGLGISSVSGDITLSAAEEIRFDKSFSGYVRTTGGGNITATANAGSIITGGGKAGYIFKASSSKVPYGVSPSLGGFSTAAGGNVTLIAGRDIISYLPDSNDDPADAGSGAFGPNPGNVTIQAGANVYGHYVVANGIGQIQANQNAGAFDSQLALSLVRGSWTVTANDIVLQEVRNPNGIFNNKGNPATSKYYHLFDYASDAQVTLNAANSIQLYGGGLPRVPEDPIPVVFPPTLALNAGAGGVTLGNASPSASMDLILFPSPTGQLNIDSKGGIAGYGYSGSSITLSDSAKTQYISSGDFSESDHASIPVHQVDSVPVSIKSVGDVKNVSFFLSKPGTVAVTGNLVESAIYWQNLHPGDKSYLSVTGDIINPNDFTYLPLGPNDPDPDFSYLLIGCPYVGAKLSYDQKSRTIILEGRLQPEQADQLKNYMIGLYDSNGNAILDERGQMICVPHYLLSNEQVDALYSQSQNLSTASQLGYRVSGPGDLFVMARNIDLGASAGFFSVGPGANSFLAQNALTGANMTVNTTGNLKMFASAIVSQAGGAICVDSKGSIEVGSTISFPNSTDARGIYSTAGSPVKVLSTGNIEINGSRIGTYDGGTVTVTSREGNVDAGTGGLSLQTVYRISVDPFTREVITTTDFIPGSGILATTFSTGSSPVGDINIATPRGDLIARSGGVLQAPFNGTVNTSKVTVNAGSPNPDDPSKPHIGNIDASGSGIVGGNIDLTATGDIKGVVFASGNANVNTPQNVNVTLLAGGSANVTGGTVSGTIIGIGSANVTGANVEATVLSNDANVSGSSGNNQVGFTQGTAAVAAGNAAAAESASKTGIASAADDEKKKKELGKPARISLGRTVGRVTVLLP